MNDKDWQQALRRYIASGQKQYEFCSNESLPFQKFKYYWQKHGKALRQEVELVQSRPFEAVTIEKPKLSPAVNCSEQNQLSQHQSHYKSDDSLISGLTLKFPSGMSCHVEFSGNNHALISLVKEVAQLC